MAKKPEHPTGAAADAAPAAGSAEAAILRGREVIRWEAEAVARLEGRIGEAFGRAVEILLDCVEPADPSAGPGKIIVTGVGKSGIIGKKIAATLSSTGATAFFLHPAEAIHGDLGVVHSNDVVLALSKSGQTEELAHLLPTFRRIGNRLIALTGDPASPLAERADVVLDVGVAHEACHLDLAPTTSTTAALAMGDALAMALFHRRGLTEDDFALWHPGGSLGKRLTLRVEDLMHVGPELPLVQRTVRMREAIVEMVEKRLGAIAVVDDAGRLVGIVTDGDLKRILVRHPDISDVRVDEVMTTSPRTISRTTRAVRALRRMEEDPRRLINCLLVVDEEGRPEGILHLHDCLQAGLS